jgi:hypothetical protein
VTDFFLFVVLLYFFSSLNSSSTTSGVTQPRSQQRERSASAIRPRDNSHIGVSGTCKMDSMGKCAQMEMIEIFVLEVTGSHLGWDVDNKIETMRGFSQYLHVD